LAGVVERKQDDIAIDRGRKADAADTVIAGRELKYRGAPLQSDQLSVDQEAGRSAERAIADEAEAAAVKPKQNVVLGEGRHGGLRCDGG
jgi:hypothetical protein